MSKNSVTNPAKPILLLGAYGRGNAGDDIFMICAVELFRGRKIYVNSAHDNLLPKEARDKIETISTIRAGDLLKKIRLLIRIPTVVYWGGDLWALLYGTRMPRQLLYKMLIINTILKLTGKKVYYIGCGIGDLNGYSLWLARASARMSDLIVAREQRSANKLGLNNVVVLPDIAINLPYVSPKMHKLPGKEAPFSIVVSVLWSIPQPEQNFPKLIGEIAGLLNSLPPNQYEVTLLPMQISRYEESYDDLWASRQLASLITNQPVTIHTNRNIQSVNRLVRDANLVIGTRLHACILSILNATPTIGIAYRPKISSYFKDNNLSAYCIDLDNLDQLADLFHKLRDEYGAAASTFHRVSTHTLSKRQAYAELIKDSIN